VLELLAAEPQQQQSASAEQDGIDAAGCEQLLVLHQLTWQLEAMQVLLQATQAAHGANSSSEWLGVHIVHTASRCSCCLH
jgi:hypothetical protein